MKLILVSALFLSSPAFANQTAVSVSGFDHISGSDATDCSFVSQSLNGNGTLAVGINSSSAEYVNTLARIPQKDLPLREGYTFADERGMNVAFANGLLTVKRQTSSLGDTEVTEMEIQVDANLQRATRASVTKKDGPFSQRTEASIDCSFF